MEYEVQARQNQVENYSLHVKVEPKGIEESKKILFDKSKEEISEIPAQRHWEFLESSDEAVYSTPENYDKLVSIGWKKFVEDTDQIRARASSVRLSSSQKWVIEKLMKIGNIKQFDEQKAEIETLRKAFNIPILKGKLNRELGKN